MDGLILNAKPYRKIDENQELVSYSLEHYKQKEMKFNELRIFSQKD